MGHTGHHPHHEGGCHEEKQYLLIISAPTKAFFHFVCYRISGCFLDLNFHLDWVIMWRCANDIKICSSANWIRVMHIQSHLVNIDLTTAWAKMIGPNLPLLTCTQPGPKQFLWFQARAWIFWPVPNSFQPCSPICDWSMLFSSPDTKFSAECSFSVFGLS